MSNKGGNFPWHFFYSSAKFHGLVLAISIISTVIVYRYYLRKGFINQIQDEVQTSLVILQQSFQKADINFLKWCQNIPADKNVRYSIIEKDGTIICDSMVDIKKLSGNNKRPEIQRALKNGSGTSFRYSETLRKEMIYGASIISWLDSGVKREAVLRKAVPVEKLQSSISAIDKSILLVAPTLFIVIYLVLLWSMLNVSRPINKVLNQISEMERKLPFHVKLKLIYKRDEWSQIYEALKQAEENIEYQLNLINDENEKTATLLESITDAIFAVDIHQSSLFFNNKFETQFIKKKTDAIVTENIKLWKVIEGKKITKAYEDALKMGKSTISRGHTFDRKDQYFDISVTPLQNRKKEIIGAVGVFRDVTESKLTEQMRVDFIANVSHEIRTPLTSVKGFAQVLESQKENIAEKFHPYIERIILNSERMNSLFNDLLNLSVIESQNQVEFSEINLIKLISGIKDSLKQVYSKKELDIKYELEVESINADKKLFEQALINLIDNACKYTYENTEIKVSSFKEGNDVVITVSDQGPGISKEHIQRIFERFYRIEDSRARTTGGTGLGLSIVKHIINKHGGSVWAKSGPENGTIFFIKIPNRAV